MRSFDALFSKLKEKSATGEPTDWDAAAAQMRDLARNGLETSKMAHQYGKIVRATKGRKDLRILDYGCGGGMTVIALLLAGYTNVRGVGIRDQEDNNKFAARLGFSADTFQWYDMKTLPYEDGSFDLVLSQQVLEHVRDMDAYYFETARVLAPGGTALLDFPHRLAPYDSHSRKYFIHYFPRALRRPLYNALTKEGFEYFDDMLHLRTIGQHRRCALKYFTKFENKTADRLRKFEYGENYEGNLGLRKLADGLIRSPLLGPLFLFAFTKIAIADIQLAK